MTIQEQNECIKSFNSFIRFINSKIEYIISRDGELNKNYFSDDTEKEMDRLSKFKTVQEIVANINDIKKCHAKLKDGYKGYSGTGRVSTIVHLSKYDECKRGGTYGIKVSVTNLKKYAKILNENYIDKFIPIPNLSVTENIERIKNCKCESETSPQMSYYESTSGHGWCCKNCGRVHQWG